MAFQDLLADAELQDRPDSVDRRDSVVRLDLLADAALQDRLEAEAVLEREVLRGLLENEANVA